MNTQDSYGNEQARRTGFWAVQCHYVPATGLLLLLPRLIDSDTLQAKLQATIEQLSNGQIYYQKAELSFLPRLSITLYQVKLDIPEWARGTVDTAQVYPELWPLLTGQLRFAKLLLNNPEFS